MVPDKITLASGVDAPFGFARLSQCSVSLRLENHQRSVDPIRDSAPTVFCLWQRHNLE